MPRVLLGPILRYVGETEATVWVETDEAAEVAIASDTARTFQIGNRHYALVHVQGLEPGTITPYEVHLNGDKVWPEQGSNFPPSVIHTHKPDEPIKVIWGSCRVALPHDTPYSKKKDDDSRGREIDALFAYALRMMERDPSEWPHLMLWLGDQVYADEVSPRTKEFIEHKRDPKQPPGYEVADFDEYRCLYHDSWGEDDVIRWLLSTVSTAMIFDDHDVHDDWNTSHAWREEMRAKPWWEERIVGAFMSYWLYQHLGNLSPRQLERDELYRKVREADDGAPLLREAAKHWDAHTDGSQWSYCRDIGRTRIVVVDSRAGRVLDAQTREMLDEDEWAWLEEHCRGDFDHLVIATSLPFLLQPGLHWLEAWDERIAGGAWGERLKPLGEKLRQDYDLEHWAAFEDSFHRMVELVRSVGAGERGEPPATIVFLSGDVHNAYVADVAFRRGSGVRSRVYQGVCSPFRNPLDRHERLAIELASTRGAAALTHALARRAGVRDPGIRWRLDRKPIFDNQVATLDWEGRELVMTVERALPGDPDRPRMDTTFDRRLA